MTDTAKPTPGPVRFTDVDYGDWPEDDSPRQYVEGGPYDALWSNATRQPIMVAHDASAYVARLHFPNPADKDFIVETYSVYTSSGLTRRQLLEQRDALQERVRELEAAQTDLIRELRHLMGVVEGYMFDAGDGVHVADTLADAAALIEKHGEKK